MELIAALREHIDRQAAVEATLVQVPPGITPFIDTKGRAEAETFNAAVSAMADTLGRRWESMSARERIAGASAWPSTAALTVSASSNAPERQAAAAVAAPAGAAQP